MFNCGFYRIFAEGEIASSSNGGSNEQPLGVLPHQIRGSLSQFSQMTLVGHSSDSCTACSSTVSSSVITVPVFYVEVLQDHL